MHNQERTPCTVWEEKLATTHPDDLSALEREALENHLATCPRCQATYRQFQKVNTLIRDAFPTERSLGLWKLFLDDENSSL